MSSDTAPNTSADTKPEGTLPEGSLKHISVKLVGEDGNIYNLMGICQRETRRQGSSDDLDTCKQVLDHLMGTAESYDQALAILMTHFDVS